MKGTATVAFVLIAVTACGRIGFDLEQRELPGDASSDASSDAALDAPGPCSFTCVDDYAGMSSSCGANPITYVVISPGDPHVLRADLAGFASLEATIEVCDPVGPVFQIADSATTQRTKGDTGQVSNDAHLLVLGSTLDFHRNDYGVGSVSVTDFVTPTGCSTRTIFVADGVIQAPDLTVTDDTALRLDPPSDAQGTPDRFWYLGINRTVYVPVADEGSGLQRVTFCLR